MVFSEQRVESDSESQLISAPHSIDRAAPLTPRERRHIDTGFRVGIQMGHSGLDGRDSLTARRMHRRGLKESTRSQYRGRGQKPVTFLGYGRWFLMVFRG